ncbi:MAG: hypothetical protein AAGG48_26895 [Planctomycetota bacterium]
MTKTKTDRRSTPVDTVDPEVIAFRKQFDERSPLDQIIQEGARRMLQATINAEVEAFIDQHRDRTDDRGRRLVVKNGSLPAREVLTGAGPIEVEQGRVRDKSTNPDDRVRFAPSVLAANRGDRVGSVRIGMSGHRRREPRHFRRIWSRFVTNRTGC